MWMLWLRDYEGPEMIEILMTSPIEASPSFSRGGERTYRPLPLNYLFHRSHPRFPRDRPVIYATHGHPPRGRIKARLNSGGSYLTLIPHFPPQTAAARSAARPSGEGMGLWRLPY